MHLRKSRVNQSIKLPRTARRFSGSSTAPTCRSNGLQHPVEATNSAESVTSASEELLLDSAADGLPHSWGIEHFGNTTSQHSADAPDGDGISSLDEFLGFELTNQVSLRPQLTAYSGAGGSVTVIPMKISYKLGEVQC
jgi:hypothetical protein